MTTLNSQRSGYPSNLNILQAWMTFMLEDRGLASFSCILYSLWLILAEDGPAAQEDRLSVCQWPRAEKQRYAKARGRV